MVCPNDRLNSTHSWVHLCHADICISSLFLKSFHQLVLHLPVLLHSEWHVHCIDIYNDKNNMTLFWKKSESLQTGLQFVKSMMFNCGNPREPKGTQGNPREPKGTSLGDPWWSLVTPFYKWCEWKRNEKRGENSPKTGVNGFPKNWNGILRHAINEWRPN